MDDREIINLYFERSEEAILQTRQKYGRLCRQIAHNILKNNEDTEECVSDTYFRAWNTIPPENPKFLSAYLCKITRNLALDRYRKTQSAKRGGSSVDAVLDELTDCLPTLDQEYFEDTLVDQVLLDSILQSFLEQLSHDARVIFVRRYFYLYSVKEISQEYQISQSKVKMSLLRSRKRLQSILAEEGFYGQS